MTETKNPNYSSEDQEIVAIEKFKEALVQSLNKRLDEQDERDLKALEAAIQRLAKTAQKCGVTKGICYGIILSTIINVAAQLFTWYFGNN